jgi:hypothetical protein
MSRIFDAFATTLTVFLLGALMAVFVLLTSHDLLGLVIALFEVRMVMPIQAASRYGSSAVALLIFMNNSIPPLLSFLYPFILGRITWDPPLSGERRGAFLRLFSVTVAFLLGFFGLGAGVAISFSFGEWRGVYALLGTAWLHGPLEFGSLVLCVSEPLRLVHARDASDLLSKLELDLRRLIVALIVLLLSSLIEVFATI